MFAHNTAEKMGIPFLGEIPLDSRIRETSDEGKPITVLQPKSPLAKSYFDIASVVVEKIDTLAGSKASEGPRIVIEH